MLFISKFCGWILCGPVSQINLISQIRTFLDQDPCHSLTFQSIYQILWLGLRACTTFLSSNHFLMLLRLRYSWVSGWDCDCLIEMFQDQQRTSSNIWFKALSGAHFFLQKKLQRAKAGQILIHNLFSSSLHSKPNHALLNHTTQTINLKHWPTPCEEDRRLGLFIIFVYSSTVAAW